MADLDPSEYTVTELRKELDGIENVEELQDVLDAETESDDRKTAKEVIQNRLDVVSGAEDEPEYDTTEGTDAGAKEETEMEADAEEADAEAVSDGEEAEDADEEAEAEGEEEEDDGLTHPTADKKHIRALENGVYRDMWVYCETHDGELLDVAKEMVSEARDLMDEYNDDYGADERVVGVLVGDDVADLAEEVIAYGADVAVYYEDDRLERFRHKPYTVTVADMATADASVATQRKTNGEAVSEEWREDVAAGAASSRRASRHAYDKPRYFLFPATNNGRDLSAQVQAQLDSGLASDCNELYIENELISNPVKTGTPGEKVDFERVLHMKRPDFSGFEWSTILCLDNPGREFHPQGCSVIPGSFPIRDPDYDREGLVVEHDVDLSDDDFRVEVVDYEKLDTGIDLTGYEVVVALGRGIGDDPTHGIELGLDLVDAFDDAELGLSRGVVTASYQVAGHVEKYVTEARQIGETGQVVAPKLYIAAGISGAIQHKVGMDESDTIISINTDPEATIKDFSDYFVVGDLFDVLPRLTEAVETGELRMPTAADGGASHD